MKEVRAIGHGPCLRAQEGCDSELSNPGPSLCRSGGEQQSRFWLTVKDLLGQCGGTSRNPWTESVGGGKIQVDNPWKVLLGRPKAQLGHLTTSCLSPLVNVFQGQASLLVLRDFPLPVTPACLDLMSLVPYSLAMLPYSSWSLTNLIAV